MKKVNSESAKQHLENVDFDTVVRKCMNDCPWMSGGFATASMDLVTGEIFHWSGCGSNEPRFENPTLRLFSINNINAMEGWTPEDLLDEDEFPQDKENTWDVIRALPDLRERMIDASITFYDAADSAKVGAQHTLSCILEDMTMQKYFEEYND